MRTTLNLDDELLRAARREAAERGTTLAVVIEEALAAALAPREEAHEPFRLEWRTHRGRLVAPIDVADRDELHAAMEEGTGVRGVADGEGKRGGSQRGARREPSGGWLGPGPSSATMRGLDR